MAEWKPFIGRFSFFPMPTSTAVTSAHELYREIWGTEPDNYQRSQNALSPASASGKVGSMVVSCLVHPTRIDLNLTAAPTSDSQQGLPFIQDGDELRSEMRRIAKLVRNRPGEPQLSRVALFLQFLSPQKTISEGNKAAGSIIPEKYGLRIQDEEDFIFQINQPYASKFAAETRMNCITKWSVERIQLMTVNVPSQGMSAGEQLRSPRITVLIAASVSFDINNSPADTPLPAVKQSALLEEALEASQRLQLETVLRGIGTPHAKPN